MAWLRLASCVKRLQVADIRSVKYTANYEAMKLVESRELQGTCLCGTFNQKRHLDGVHTQLYMYTSIL
jgi:hypothetical protein